MLSYESETNQHYLNNNENLSDSNIYLENSNEISTILEASEQKDANLFSSKENFQFSFPLSFNRITNMSNMFYKCNSLISLPDISNWNLSKVNSMSHMFSGCNSLKSLPYFYMLNKFQNDVIFEVTYKNNEGKVKILGKNFIEKKR